MLLGGEMDWIDYREKLGIGLNDDQKKKFFINNIFNFLNNIDIFISSGVYLKYCLTTGTKAFIDDYKSDYYECIVDSLSKRTKDINDFLSHYVAFANILINDDINIEYDFIQLLKTQLSNAHIMYDIVEIDGEQLVFPIGVPEFDKALVSETLLWLKNYPEAEKAWSKALKRYSDMNSSNASEIADLFRKALERFFQEFFKSNKSLENYIGEYGKYLEEKGVPKEISNELEKLLNMFTKYNNNYAKHADRSDINVLEYIMYQTGNIMRLMIKLNEPRDLETV